jgi:hypothetical protein
MLVLMIKNTPVSITDKGVKFMLLIILLAMTSCGTETVFYWNMRDVIGLSISVLLLLFICFNNSRMVY